MSSQQTKNSDTKSKSKFQSLNINNIYQGAANKPTSKNLPPKHGLQSLGKVPTVRRAPANLPSVKSENGGNDPSVVLVPSGGGWANKDGKKEGSVEKKLVQTSDPGQKQACADVAQASQTKQGSPLSSASKSGTKSWSSVTGSGHSPGQESGRKPQYLHQKSPLFGQEFPSLAGENVPAGSTIARETMLEQDRSQPPPGQDMSAPPDPAYGPGPNLRPQTFGNWTQGGGKAGGGGPMTEEEDKLLPAAPQPHKPQPPTASGKSHGTTQFKSIMPPFMDAMELPTGPPQSYGKKPSSRNNPAFRQGRDNNRPRPDNTASFTNHSIIDKEKLQKMDDFDNGNDWTFDDDDFDYNKKLESDDDETSEANQSNSMTSDPNWADQVHSNHQSQHNKNSQSYYYDDYKTKPAVGFDDEERRRNKKSEEVMKNIERARQRREEEENRYRDNRDRQSDHYRDSYNGGHRSGGQARRYDDRQQYDGYDRKKDDYRARYERDDDAHARRETREGWESGDRSQRSYQRHDSELSATESLEDRKQNNTLGSSSPEWTDKSLSRGQVQDWVEDVEEGEARDNKEHDRPSRPNSRDSRVSKESRESKGSRASRDREINFGLKKEEKVGKFFGEDKKSKPQQPKQSPMQDIRGYFRDDVSDQDKKPFRHAPGPITKEKLESFEMKESMTQLSKRGKSEEKKEESPLSEKIVPTNVLSSLLDSDLLENISEDDDILDNDDEEKEVSVSAGRGRGGGRGRGRGDKFVGHGRGGKVERPERGGGRGGIRSGPTRQDNKKPNKWNETEESTEVDEEKKPKKPEALMANPQPNPAGFMPRGQPSRRGRGEGRIKQGNVLGRQKVDYGAGQEEIGDWSEAGDKVGRGGKVPPRMQKSKKDGRPGSGAGDEVEEWETASETSLEEREKRNKGKPEHQMTRGRGGGQGRGGRGSAHPAGGNTWSDKRGKGGSGNAGSGSQTGAGGSAEMGPTEEFLEAPAKRASGIENFDLHDYSSVHVVDDSQWTGADNEADFDQEGEGFMPVVNKKVRGGMSGPGVNMRQDNRDRRGQDPRMMNDKKMINKNTFDRRNNKLPPRLAKQREVAKAQARTGPGQSPSPGTENGNGWPEGDKMGVFNVDTGTGAWEKPLDNVALSHGGSNNENGSIQQTIIFENTAYKGGKVDKLDKSGPIQLPLSFAKQDSDNGDLKLDFTFGGSSDENCLKHGQPPMSMPPKSLTGGLPASPSTDDLQTKLANTKKLWDAPGMPVVPENTAAGSWNEADLYSENNADTGDKSNEREPGGSNCGNSPHTGGSNIAKVKPQQQMTMDSDRSNNTALQYNRMAVPSPPGSHSLPPSQLTPLQPWAFLPDASRTSPMYNPYSPLNQSILMPGVSHNLNTVNTDLFNSHNTLRGVQGVPPSFPGSGLTTTNQLISQANLINSQVKLGSGIGPIGTKAGAAGPGPGPSSPYLANLPNTNSNIFIQYDSSGNPLNYLPGSAPPARGNPPSQTAFYQSLAAANRHQQQQAYSNALQLQMSSRMAFLKNEQGKPPASLTDTGFNTTAVPPYNGRATNPPPTGPPSPKTKLKIAQQQEQAKLTAGFNNLNINNLNALAQMQKHMQMGHFNSGMVQHQNVPGQYNPSPIARPQVSLPQGGMMTGGQLSKQMNQYFNQDGGEAAKYEAGDEALATDKADTEEGVEEICDGVTDTVAPAAATTATATEQEAAN